MKHRTYTKVSLLPEYFQRPIGIDGGHDHRICAGGAGFAGALVQAEPQNVEAGRGEDGVENGERGDDYGCAAEEADGGPEQNAEAAGTEGLPRSWCGLNWLEVLKGCHRRVGQLYRLRSGLLRHAPTTEESCSRTETQSPCVVG